MAGNAAGIDGKIKGGTECELHYTEIGFWVCAARQFTRPPLPPVACAEVAEAEVHIGVGVDVAVGVDLVGQEVDPAEDFFPGDDADKDTIFIGDMDVVVVDYGVEDVFQFVISLDEANIPAHDF